LRGVFKKRNITESGMSKAVIFDMDGVLSDTQKLHSLVDKMVMEHYGVRLEEEEITRNFAGITDKEMFERLFNLYGVPKDIDRAIQEKWEIMMQKAERDIKPVPGAVEFVRELKRQGYKLAVASSSPFIFINTVLSRLNIKKEFDIITSGEEVKRGKPDPEIFLLTAERLKVAPQECVVIEDSPSGIKAAKRAGMRCIAFVRENNKSIVVQENHLPDIIVNDLREIKIKEIEKLLI